MNCISDFFTYETTKSVVVKSWTIGIINRAVQLLIISYFVGWVFLHEKAYQVRDTAIESSVVTKVKGFGRYANRVMDVSDYVTPPQGTSVFVIITKMIVTENQMQGFCPENEEKYRCVSDSQCGPERFPGGGILTGRCVNYSSVLRTCEIQGWCPTEVDTVEMPIMMEAENFTIFIKNSIRFPLFNFEKGNLLPNLTAKDIKTCRFHPEKAPFCPILRVGDVVKFAGQDFAKLARTGGVLGIKIGWVCDLDKAWDQCIPKYSFTRLDGVSEKSSVSPGYNFSPPSSVLSPRALPEIEPRPKVFGDPVLFSWCASASQASLHPVLGFVTDTSLPLTTVELISVSASPVPSTQFAKYYKMENGSEYRTLLKAFGIRFDVLVYGNAGKFNIIPTIISSVAAFTSVGVGTVLCDIILLNFLKGADHYKARKFEEVNETTLKGTASANPVFPGDQATVEKQSTDSGAYSIGH
ncbi:P2X purinoceptor 3 [Microtus ochrogaster]|uniref:P2X purinoceptor n=1 Tax=Microtus ochrogaster TaxID=79684 RepID=A0A8J6KTS2_MICOH|nr:P2X purinoceptor 3 [Microtus ochrogaster]